MKRYVFTAIGLAFLLLAGCSPQTPPPPEDESHSNTIEYHSTSESSQEVNPSMPQETEAPPEEGMARSLLTNEWVSAEIVKNRPIAVIIPNEARAIPHYNI